MDVWNVFLHATNCRFFPTNLKSAQCLGTNAEHSRRARDKIWRSLGSRRNFELQITSERPSVFHAQRCNEPRLPVLFFAIRLSLRFGNRFQMESRSRFTATSLFSKPGPISAHRPNVAAARAGDFAGQVRSAQTQTWMPKAFLPPNVNRPLPRLPETDRYRHVGERRGDPRHSKRLATACTVVANFN